MYPNMPRNQFQRASILAKFEALAKLQERMDIKTLLPHIDTGAPPLDVVSMYGFRPKVPDLWYLSPWEFTAAFFCHQLQPPSATYQWTEWTKEGRRKRQQDGDKVIPGTDYRMRADVLKTTTCIFQLPASTDVFAGPPRVSYESIWQTWVIVKRVVPVVPCPTQTP